MIRRIRAWFMARRIVRELDSDWTEWHDMVFNDEEDD